MDSTTPFPPRKESTPRVCTPADVPPSAALKLNVPPPVFEAPKVRAGLVLAVKTGFVVFALLAATTRLPPLMVMVPLEPKVKAVLFAPRLRVPSLFLVSVPVVRVSLPVMVNVPVPPTVKLLVVPAREATVVNAPEPGTKKLLLVFMTPAPVSVAAPKVMPAVPLETLGPAVFVSVKAPRLSVPNVAVVPTPAAALSDQMVALPPTVVAPKP